jgi:hypothetical protein
MAFGNISNDINLSPTMEFSVGTILPMVSKSLFTTQTQNVCINTGIRKSFFNKTLNVTLNINDILNTSNMKTESLFPTGQQGNDERYTRMRSIELRINYRFGGGRTPQIRQRRDASIEETRRL